MTLRRLGNHWSGLLALGAAGAITAACGFSGSADNTAMGGTSAVNPGGGTTNTGAGGSHGGTTAVGNGGSVVNPGGGTSVGGTPLGGGGMNTTGGMNAGGTNPAGGTQGNGGTPATGGTGGQGGPVIMGAAPNYELSGTWPTAPIAVATAAGTLHYTKKVIHTQFLAESCSIADYNNDGMPDVSSGRIWYQGPDFTVSHPFRDGHGVLPSAGDGVELNTGVSDDWSDFPWDVNADGNMDIINVAQCDVPETADPNGNPAGTPNKIGIVQPHATAYWYENPGPAGQAGDPKWTPHLMHSDVRLEQHGLIDMNGDGFPEIYGACKGCTPATTKGYYQGDPANPMGQWEFHSVTSPFTFPFGGLGWLHGEGGGDVNGDGKPDLLERSGAWLQQPGGTWNTTECTGKDTPAGCGYIKQNFYDGNVDNDGNKGASHMYAVDMDLDGIPDVVAADWAHGEGLFWYKQDATGHFTKYQFMGGAGQADKTKWGAGFSEPHALQVTDMDGDGRPDVITGKMRFAHPHGFGDPDNDGLPYLYVFKNVAAADPNSGGPITLQPVLVDPLPDPFPVGSAGNPPQLGTTATPDTGMGVGRQLAVGHVNTDGIVDICIGSKVGLAVFLGQ
ncbi:MAG TPA: VCBS repeat-containing protein [Polyangiaceae bacterium]|nr:VCBS repeat-containing protein [Polyangiaceae bacterium]